MKLKKLLKGISFKAEKNILNREIGAVCTNSKKAKKGSLFIAMKGLNFDGNNFAEEARKKGATVILTDRISRRAIDTVVVDNMRKAIAIAASNFYNAPSKKLKTIGITGTNGKTTVSYLCESILKAAKIPCGVIGTIEYRLGKLRVPAERTTPDLLRVNHLLSRMLAGGLKAAAIEVSSHALDQGRVDGLSFDVAVFTNLTHEHLDYHKTLKRYLGSKLELFKKIKKNGTAVINRDEKNASKIIKVAGGRAITYGLRGNTDVRADIKRADLNGSSFTVHMKKIDKTIFINTPLAGEHNVYNILAAIGAALALRVQPGTIKKGIESLKSVPGRLESIEPSRGFKVFVDYAHTHNALENVLKFLTEIKTAKIITVFGCGGDRDKTKRPLMARVAQRFSDHVVITEDNPRTEKTADIFRDIKNGLNTKKQNYDFFKNRKCAIRNALIKASDGDIVLIAGKGHESVQIIGNKTIPFDDRRVAREILCKFQ